MPVNVQVDLSELVSTLQSQQAYAQRISNSKDSHLRLDASMAMEATILSLCTHMSGLSKVMTEWHSQLKDELKAPYERNGLSSQPSAPIELSTNESQLVSQAFPSPCAFWPGLLPLSSMVCVPSMSACIG
jgi:hypothetical protein